MGRPRIHSFNEDIFSKIDTIDKAYWLGFIQADGGVYKNTLTIELHPQDKIQLENFNKFVGSDREIETRLNNFDRQYYRVRLNSKKMVTDLNKVGIILNKTYIDSEIYNLIPKELLIHFYRGMIDGDGWIIKSSQVKPQYGIGLCSKHKPLLENLHSIICEAFNESKIGSIIIRTKINQFTITGNKKFPKLVNLLGYNKYYSMPRKLELINEGIDTINLLKVRK